MRLWKNYINKQKYSECQVVTAINAYYFLTGKTIKQDSTEYENLVDLVGARNGSALHIEKVHKRLGLVVTKSVKSFLDLQMSSVRHIKSNRLPLPIEATVWHKKTGYHSVLIVDQCLKTNCIRVANFRYVTSLDGWMFKEDFYQYQSNLHKDWSFRLIELKSKQRIV